MAIAGFSKIGVVGAGQMGSGIAQVCASFGLETKLYDSFSDQIEKAKTGIPVFLDKLVKKERIEEKLKTACLENLKFVTKIEDLKDCDLVMEAIIEKEEDKKNLFIKLDEMLAPNAILASNTSSISITRLASVTSRTDKFIGMHFMQPVPIMKLVEVISGHATAPKTTERIVELARGLAKETSQSKDYPGFVVNRILMPLINEAFYALMQGVSSAEDIDLGIRLGLNHPFGPLKLADYIGLDTCLAIMQQLHQGFGDPKFAPCPLLVNYVEAKQYGIKSKKGVYDY